MNAGRSVSGNAGAVLDADVVLAGLERGHRAHGAARTLFERIAGGGCPAWISAVNLAEVFAHSRQFRERTGLNLHDYLRGSRIVVHVAGAEVAERAASLAGEHRLSLADRFAAATASLLKVRLYTTDAALVKLLRHAGVPVSRL